VVNGLDSAIRSSCNALDPNPARTPFVWWLLATRRAPQLLAAIEEAMVAEPRRALQELTLPSDC
jgi:hypothetical protein